MARGRWRPTSRTAGGSSAEQQRGAARRLLLHLVMPSGTTGFVRYRADEAEIGAADWQQVAKILASHGLIVTDPSSSGAPVAEISHDALLDQWPLLKGLFLRRKETSCSGATTSGEAYGPGRRPSRAARCWSARSRRAEQWNASRREDLSEREREFIRSSRQRCAFRRAGAVTAPVLIIAALTPAG